MAANFASDQVIAKSMSSSDHILVFTVYKYSHTDDLKRKGAQSVPHHNDLWHKEDLLRLVFLSLQELIWALLPFCAHSFYSATHRIKLEKLRNVRTRQKLKT